MKTEMKYITILAILLLAMIGSVNAENFYVSTNGNDGNAGNLNSPYKTIGHGVDQCNGGDTVYVRSGTYNGNFEIENSGTSSNFNTLTNYQNEDVKITNNNIYDHGIIVDANYWIINGFEITNTWHPVKVNGNQHDIIMTNFECHYNGYSLLLQDGSYNIDIENCKFHSPYSDSTNFIGLRGEDDDISHHINIIDCDFNGCIHNSINFYSSQANEHYDGTTDVLIEGCSFSNGRQVAIFTNWCGVTRMTVRDCHFDHYARGIQAVMRDCLIEDCTVEDHGNFFVYTQADADSWDVTVRDIKAHSGNWGQSSTCIDLKKGHGFEVYNVDATGDFSETSNPSQIKDPRSNNKGSENWEDEWYGENSDDGETITTKEYQAAVHHWLDDIPVKGYLLTTEDLQLIFVSWLNE